MSPSTMYSKVFSRWLELSVQSPHMEMTKYSSCGVGSGVGEGVAEGVGAGEGEAYSGAGSPVSGLAEQAVSSVSASAQAVNLEIKLFMRRIIQQNPPTGKRKGGAPACRGCLPTHRRGLSSTPARRGMTDNVGAPVKNGARAVPAGLHTLGGEREAGAPWVTRVQSATHNSCNEPGPAVT